MKTARRDLYQEITDTILERLEAGGLPPWVKPWHTDGCGSSGIPRNGATGREYHGINTVLLWIATDAKGYNTHDWMTYRQAAGKGGQVRGGEKSTMVVFFKPLKIKAKEGERADKDGNKTVPCIRSFNVFNRDQIDGLAPIQESNVTLSDHERIEAVETWVANTGARIDEHDTEGRACYSPLEDRIRMPAIGRFVDSENYYATKLHELTHWTGHESRCDRDFARRFGNEAYAFEELVAELGAAMLCAHHQIDGELQHTQYLASWIKVLKNDKKAIIHASSKAREAAELLHDLVGTRQGQVAIGRAA